MGGGHALYAAKQKPKAISKTVQHGGQPLVSLSFEFYTGHTGLLMGAWQDIFNSGIVAVDAHLHPLITHVNISL